MNGRNRLHVRALSDASRRSFDCRGFTLLELSIVVFIVSVLAMLAVPVLKRTILESRATAVVNDLRVFSATFQTYAHERGDWPTEETEPGVPPPSMAASLGTTNWAQQTPIGGHYTWAPNSLHQGERYRAAIVLASTAESKVTADRNQLEQIDRIFDDGNLATGNFRLGYRNFPVLVIEH